MSSRRIEKTVLLVCVIQERFRPLIFRFPAVVRSARALLSGAAALGVNVITTEQNPAKLGATIAELAPLISSPIIPKMTFSMIPVLPKTMPFSHAIICGIETHVCIAQTVADLLARGIKVSVVVDGVSSQRQGDRAVALASFAASGVTLTTTEAALFWLLEDASHPKFKEVQRIAVNYSSEYHVNGQDTALDMLV